MGLFGPPNVEKAKEKGDIKGLIKALGYRSDGNVREAAAKALGEIGKPLAVEPLIAAVMDEKWQVRIAAVGALARIGDTRAVEPLIAALKHIGPSVRLAAAEALGQIGDARAVEPLIAALKDQERDVRRAAADALAELGWQPDQAMAGTDYWIAKGQWEKCVEIGALAVEPLITVLKDGASSERQAAAEALGQIRDARAVDPLTASLKSLNAEIRRAAVDALQEFSADMSLEQSLRDQAVAAVANYWIAEGEFDQSVQIGAPAVMPLITAAQDCHDPLEYAAITNAIGQIEDDRAADYLLSTLRSGSDDRRRAAAKALVKHGVDGPEDKELLSLALFEPVSTQDPDRAVQILFEKALAIAPLMTIDGIEQLSKTVESVRILLETLGKPVELPASEARAFLRTVFLQFKQEPVERKLIGFLPREPKFDRFEVSIAIDAKAATVRMWSNVGFAPMYVWRADGSYCYIGPAVKSR